MRDREILSRLMLIRNLSWPKFSTGTMSSASPALQPGTNCRRSCSSSSWLKKLLASIVSIIAWKLTPAALFRFPSNPSSGSVASQSVPPRMARMGLPSPNSERVPALACAYPLGPAHTGSKNIRTASTLAKREGEPKDNRDGLLLGSAHHLSAAQSAASLLRGPPPFSLPVTSPHHRPCSSTAPPLACSCTAPTTLCVGGRRLVQHAEAAMSFRQVVERRSNCRSKRITTESLRSDEELQIRERNIFKRATSSDVKRLT